MWSIEAKLEKSNLVSVLHRTGVHWRTDMGASEGARLHWNQRICKRNMGIWACRIVKKLTARFVNKTGSVSGCKWNNRFLKKLASQIPSLFQSPAHSDFLLQKNLEQTPDRLDLPQRSSLSTTWSPGDLPQRKSLAIWRSFASYIARPRRGTPLHSKYLIRSKKSQTPPLSALITLFYNRSLAKKVCIFF